MEMTDASRAEYRGEVESLFIDDINYNFNVIKLYLDNLFYKLNYHSEHFQKHENNLDILIDSLEAKLDALKETGINKQPGNDKVKHRQIDRDGMDDSKNHLAQMNNDMLRKAIVDLMVLSLQCWTQYSQESKIELAEKSKQWAVYVCNGRLSTRTMDRYLNINTLPKFPRWNNVLKTASFVLNECPSTIPIKKSLERSLRLTQELMKQQALYVSR